MTCPRSASCWLEIPDLQSHAPLLPRAAPGFSTTDGFPCRVPAIQRNMQTGRRCVWISDTRGVSGKVTVDAVGSGPGARSLPGVASPRKHSGFIYFFCNFFFF